MFVCIRLSGLKLKHFQDCECGTHKVRDGGGDGDRADAADTDADRTPTERVPAETQEEGKRR